MLRISLSGLLLVVAGCGGGGLSLAPVSGKVTFDGKPLANATVGFYPEGPNSGVNSSGKTNENGEYTLMTVVDRKTGAVVGKHRVSIIVASDTAGSDAPADKLPKNRAPKIPTKYFGEESILSCVVPSDGKTDANFDLQSK
jgi:hypothetical protein